MASSTHQYSIQEEAVARAKAAFHKLPLNDELLQQCIANKVSIETVLKRLRDQSAAHQRKRSTKLLEKFHNHTSWMMNMSRSIDVAVNASAGIACPVWASVKFVLMISHENVTATEKILGVICAIADNLPRFELYSTFHDDLIFRVALIDLFTDITEFSVQAYSFLGRKSISRLSLLFRRNFDAEFGTIVSRIERRTRVVDTTAIALYQKRLERQVLEGKSRDLHECRTRTVQWLQSANIREYHERKLSAIADGTCKWIFDHKTFQAWNSASPGSFLLIHGRAGCGKSTLGSYIHAMFSVQDDQTLISPMNSYHIREDTVQILFSFSSADSCRQTTESLLRAILAQLLEQDRQDVALTCISKLMEKASVSTNDLSSAVSQIIAALPLCTTIIIDGIDECSDTLTDLFAQILALRGNESRTKILLLGQSHCFSKLENQWSQAHTIHIVPELNLGDIRTVVEMELKRNSTSWNALVSERILESLLDNADGMFLWVGLMLDYLKSASSETELFTFLDELPEGLEQAYTLLLNRLWNRLRKHQRNLVKRLLAIIITCGRPLNLHELQSMSALVAEGSTIKAKERVAGSPMLTLPPDEIVRLCGGLITFTDDSFHVVHNSAREFLISSYSNQPVDNRTGWACFLVDLSETHTTLADVCLGVFQEAPSSPSLAAEDHCRHLVMKYACVYAALHLSHAGRDDDHLRASLRSLLESPTYLHVLEELASSQNLDEELQCFGDNLWTGLWQRIKSRLQPGLSKTSHSDSFEEILPVIFDLFDLPTKSYGGLSHDRANQPTAPNPPLPASAPCESSAMDSDIKTRSKENDVGEPSAMQAHRNSSKEVLPPNVTTRVVARAAKGLGIAHENSANGALLHSGNHLSPLVGLLKHLHAVKSLIDPFKLFWDRVRKSMKSMSPLLMTGVTYYCLKVGKIDEALEIGTECTRKLNDSGTLINVLHDSVMYHVYNYLGDNIQCLEHLHRVRTALLKPTRKLIWEWTSDNLLLTISETYSELGDEKAAQAILQQLQTDRMKILTPRQILRLFYGLGSCELGAHRPATALEYFLKYQEVFNAHFRSQMDHTYNKWPSTSFIRSFVKTTRCFFELRQDANALRHIHELEVLAATGESSIAAKKSQFVEDHLSDVDEYRKILSAFQIPSDRSLDAHIQAQCRCKGSAFCLQTLQDVYFSSEWIVNNEVLVDRGLDSCIEYCQAHEIAHRCNEESCPLGIEHAWHVAASHYWRFWILHEVFDFGFRAIEAVQPLTRFIETINQHCGNQDEDEMWHETDLKISTAIFKFAAILEDSHSYDDLLISVCAARISSNFDLMATEPDEEELEASRIQTLDACRNLWTIRHSEASKNPSWLSGAKNDYIQLFRSLQSKRLCKSELKAKYITTEALLLPETWNLVEQEYLHGRERRFSRTGKGFHEV